MKKLKEYWNKKLWYEKVIFVIGIVAYLSLVVLTLLELFNIVDNVLSLSFPLLALCSLYLGFEHRKASSSLMFFSLGLAALEIIFWIIVLYL